MDEKMERRLQRKYFGTVGWTLLAYNLIMTVCVLAVMIVNSLMITYGQMNGIQYSENEVMDIMANNGTGYLIASALGLLILRLWRGKNFLREILVPGRPMGKGDFFSLTAIFLGGQMVFSMLSSVVSVLLEMLGLSMTEVVGSTSISTDSFSMFLYVCLVAPIVEEVLFRGLILRLLMPCGKGFAIVMSAFVFGVFHGDLLQIPFAFVVGLVLGYTAAEHNIVWAMVLHMINNLVLVDMLPRLTSFWPAVLGDLLISLVILTAALAAFVILIVRHKEVALYNRVHAIDTRYVFTFLTSAPVVGLMIAMLLSAVTPMITALVQNMGAGN